MLRLDQLGESASRWLASRFTRRSFLGASGKAALVVAGGAGLAELFASRAEARQCGQSGISPKCPTFDCVGSDVAWGWCWYASPGCCADGGLKKICDCCKTNHPNVQGYCPEGSAVYCMVESCLEDPRVQTVPVERYLGADAAEISMARSVLRKAGSARTVVMSNGFDPLMAAVAVPVASALGVPLLLTDPDATRRGVREELDRLGASQIIVVGPGLSGVEGLNGVERIGGGFADAASVSVEVAAWLSGRGVITSVVCIGSSTNSIRIGAVAASYAAIRNVPLLVGVASVGLVRPRLSGGFGVLLIGDDVAEAKLDAVVGLGGIDRLRGSDPSVISQAVADRFFTKVPNGTFPIVIASDDPAQLELGTLPSGGVVVVHGDGGIDPALRDWLRANRKRFSNADVVSTGRSALTDQGIYDLQSAVNGYETLYLIGKDGQGLPVIAQPLEEREQGKAKVRGKPIPPTTIASKANAKRKPAPNPAPPVSTPPTPVPRTIPPVPSTTTTTTTTTPTTTTPTPATVSTTPSSRSLGSSTHPNAARTGG